MITRFLKPSTSKGETVKIKYDKILGKLREEDSPVNPETSFVYGLDYCWANYQCKTVTLNHAHDEYGDALRYDYPQSLDFLPAHNTRRCLMTDLENETIAYYCHPANSNLKEDGTAAVLTGADGDVMVECTPNYWRYDVYTDTQGRTHIVTLVSDVQFNASEPDPFFYVSRGGKTLKTQYVGAFKGVLCDSSGVAKAQSAEGTPAAFATGNKMRSIAGARPAGSMNRATMRTAAVNNGGTLVNFLFNAWAERMIAIKVGTYNTQTGISAGFSNLSAWDYAALRKTGRTASLGNGDGSILADDAGLDADLLTMKAGATIWNNVAADQRIVACAALGFEDLWGSQWTFDDGIQWHQSVALNHIQVSDVEYYRTPESDNGTTAYAWKSAGDVLVYTAANRPAANAAVYSDNAKTTQVGTVTSYTEDVSQNGYWITSDIDSYSLLDTDRGYGNESGVFPSTGYTGPTYVWVHHTAPETEGYIKDFNPHTFLPTTLGGNSTNGVGDYFYANATAGARVVFRGGLVSYGAYCGLAFVNVRGALGNAIAGIGCRVAARGPQEAA